MAVEDLAEFLVELYSIRMDAHVQGGSGRQSGAEHRGEPVHAVVPEQKRLAAVKHHASRGEAVLSGVLLDPPDQLDHGLRRHRGGPPAPRGVLCLIYIAVVACQVASTMYFDDKLLQWHRRPGHVARSPFEDQIEELKPPTVAWPESASETP